MYAYGDSVVYARSPKSGVNKKNENLKLRQRRVYVYLLSSGLFPFVFFFDRLLRRGSMFVFSTDQIRQLLNITYFASGSTLIDLGAGDGATTEKYTPLVRHVYTTEKSGPMIRILARKGFG